MHHVVKNHMNRRIYIAKIRYTRYARKTPYPYGKHEPRPSRKCREAPGDKPGASEQLCDLFQIGFEGIQLILQLCGQLVAKLRVELFDALGFL